MAPLRKKLIEVSIPLEAINAASAREKSIRHGHPSTLHLWWARRPLAACRAVLFAQLVDDPSAWPEEFPTEAVQEAERKRLHAIIARMVPWEASNDETILTEARWEIARSVARGLGEPPPPKEDGQAILDYLQTKAPPVYDPFSGGGSIPLEAQRLGLRAYGSDINPVAVLIGKALVEIPPKFAGRPPVNPDSRTEAVHGELRAWRGAQGLAEDVRYYGRWMRDEAERRIGHLYPKATLPDGTQATVIAWLWARTVRSPDPAAKGAMVPLVSSFMLSTKEGKKAWVEPVIDADAPDGWRFEVKNGTLEKAHEERLKRGTKTGRGEFCCILTGARITDDYIRKEFLSEKGNYRIFSVVAEKKRGKIYLPCEYIDLKNFNISEMNFDPQQEMFKGALGFRLQAYGVKRWGEFFRIRQKCALSVFSDLIIDVMKKIESDLSFHHNEYEEYIKSIAVYLVCCLGRAVDYWTINTIWEPSGEFIVHTFSEMTIPVVWDAAEANPFAHGGGGWEKTCLDWVCRVIDVLPATSSARIINNRAQKLDSPHSSTFSFDPPYFDNIGYADLSDAFYVWEREILLKIYPELGRRLSTPKEDELVATPARHGGSQGARNFFLKNMTEVFGKIKCSESNDPITIYYSYKEKGQVGKGTGWESFLEAIAAAGWQIDASWPLTTERPTRNRSIGKAALASSIVLVCRKRPENALVATRAEFLRTLKRDLPGVVEEIRAAGVGPVDMPQSVIGPGMGVFTRYARVLEDDDSPMSVKTALALINRIWSEIDNDLDANFDPETQTALAWFATYGFEAHASGDLIILATAKNIPADALFSSGVFQNLHGKASLTPREALARGWFPVAGKPAPIWLCVQHIARVLNAEDGGTEAAARLVAALGDRAGDARALIYRLYQIASDKSWSAEALVYNQIAQEWGPLDARAAEMGPGEKAGVSIQELLL